MLRLIVPFLPNLLYEVNHLKSKFNSIFCMKRIKFWNSRYTVVTVSKDFNSHTVVFLKVKRSLLFLSLQVKMYLQNNLSILEIIEYLRIPIGYAEP